MNCKRTVDGFKFFKFDWVKIENVCTLYIMILVGYLNI